jgi:hypothetical protein
VRGGQDQMTGSRWGYTQEGRAIFLLSLKPRALNIGIIGAAFLIVIFPACLPYSDTVRHFHL